MTLSLEQQQANAARDLRVVQDRYAGYRYREIAERHGISTAHAWQIYKKHIELTKGPTASVEDFGDVLWVNDAAGRWEARVREDGCLEFYQFFNDERDIESESTDRLHICNIRKTIAALQEIQKIALQKYGDQWLE